MIEEIGIVKSVEGPVAVVDVPRKSACEGCTAGTCKVEDQTMEIEAFNKAGARVGQKVRVMVHSYAYMKGSMVVYGIPAVGLVLGAVLGKEVASRYITSTDPDALSAFFGFGFLALSFLLVKFWTKAKARNTETKPVIEEILQ
jgi:sigma-E factor negative regulatory protein RseC